MMEYPSNETFNTINTQILIHNHGWILKIQDIIFINTQWIQMHIKTMLKTRNINKKIFMYLNLLMNKKKKLNLLILKLILNQKKK